MRIFCSIICLSLISSSAAAVDLNLELGLFNRFTLKRNGLERYLRYDSERQAFDFASYQAPVQDRAYYSVVLRAGALLEATSWLEFGLAVDSGEINPTGKIPAETTVPLTSRANLIIDDPIALSTRDLTKVTSNGQLIGDEAAQTFFIRQAFVRLSAPETGWLSAVGGRMMSEVAGGLIFNDSSLGGQLVADLERLKDWPLRFSLQALLPTRSWDSGLNSPLLEFRFDYIFSSFLSMTESIGLTFAYFHDGDSNFGQLYASAISEVPVRYHNSLDNPLYKDLFAVASSAGLPSSANIFWVGLDGTKLLGDFLVAGAAFLEIGHLSLENPFAELHQAAPGVLPSQIPQSRSIEMDTLGWALDLSLKYLITEDMTVSAFFIYLSGENNPYLAGGDYDDSYSSFLAVVPYVTHTNLFFSGGMNETFSGRQATTSGINGRGVIAGGATFSWDINEDLRVGSKLAPLFSPVPSMVGGDFYGFETDFEGSYEIFDFLRVSLEYDFLVPGGFFANRAVMHKMLVGLDLIHSW